MSASPSPSPSPLRKRLVLIGLALVALWVFFLDSHSVLKRLQMTYERRVLQAEVETLQAENEELQDRLRTGITDDIVEEVAREQYGMRRPGEVVYPVEHGRR